MNKKVVFFKERRIKRHDPWSVEEWQKEGIWFLVFFVLRSGKVNTLHSMFEHTNLSSGIVLVHICYCRRHNRLGRCHLCIVSALLLKKLPKTINLVPSALCSRRSNSTTPNVTLEKQLSSSFLWRQFVAREKTPAPNTFSSGEDLKLPHRSTLPNGSS